MALLVQPIALPEPSPSTSSFTSTSTCTRTHPTSPTASPCSSKQTGASLAKFTHVRRGGIRVQPRRRGGVLPPMPGTSTAPDDAQRHRGQSPTALHQKRGCGR